MERVTGFTRRKKLVIPHSLPVVEGDLSQYRQLFKSLLQNVLKFKKKDLPSEAEVVSEEMTADQKKIIAYLPIIYTLELRSGITGLASGRNMLKRYLNLLCD
jgi:hypothetical protein